MDSSKIFKKLKLYIKIDLNRVVMLLAFYLQTCFSYQKIYNPCNIIFSMKIGFDNEKYISLQREKILERILQFGDKLYLEFGGKLFDDFHASRVLPGFEPDTKIRMLSSLSDKIEIILVISADDIEK